MKNLLQTSFLSLRFLFSINLLDSIIDPRGIMVARNEYDADGRLIAHVDADGKRIEYTHNIAGRTEIINDRNNHASLFVYDNAGNVIAETNPEGETILHEYNNIYLETKRTDPLGNETSWSYDQQGNQLTETDEINNTTSNTYNERGEILSETNKFGNLTLNSEYNAANAFQGAAKLAKVKDVFGATTEFHWLTGTDGNQNSITVNTGYTDANGNRYMIEPIAQGNGTNSGINGASINLNGLKTKLTYDDEARPLTSTQIITDANGDITAQYITSFEYNVNGDLIKTIDPQGNITRVEYNELNKKSATIDSNNNRTEYTYDDLARLVKTTFADGTSKLSTFDAVGNETSVTDREGNITKTIYDALNRPIETILPDATQNDDSDNPRSVIEYNAIGQMISIKDPLGNMTRFEYDALGKRINTIDALGNEIHNVFDKSGIIIQKIDALGRVTKFENDILGNLVKTIFPDDTPNDDSDNLFTTKVYDELNRKTSETDLARRATQYGYDNASNLTAVIDSLNQRTEYQYDQRGNKITQTDANGNTTNWAYDELNRISSITLPEGMVKTYTYDEIGNLLSKTDFNGDTTHYEYNNVNLQTKITYADNSIVTSTYNASGQIASITQSQGTTSYQYDVRDRLTKIDYPDGNFIAYKYDKNSNRTQVKTASQIVNYTFDALNRLATVADVNGVTGYTYDVLGNRATQTNANGIVVSYTYDTLNRLTNLAHTNSNNTVVASYQYDLGANGNRQSITEITGRVVDYQYDELYRLITETITDPINGNHTNQWSYDAVGNRLQQNKDGITTTYIYNNNDHLLSETSNGITTTYSYDNNGNTLSKHISGTLNNSYSYNKADQLIQVITPSSIINYQYDLMGIKQSQSIGGVITNYLIDPNQPHAQVLEEQDSNNLPQVIYVYGDDLINQTQEGLTHVFGYDGLGSTRILTDTNGTVQNSYAYLAFGELDYQFGTVVNNYLFTGEQYDNNIGFYYLRARFYNPSIGRFQNMDSFTGMQFEPITLHKYLYANANPSNFIDPSGNIGILAGVNRAFKVLGVLALYGVAAINVVARVENGVSLFQGVAGLYAAWNKLKSAGLSFRVEGDSEFNEAMQNWDNALYVLTKNMGRIFHDMAGNKRKRNQVQNFVKKDKSSLLIFGPTPNRRSDWFPSGTRVGIGKISIGKRKKDIKLELGRSSRKGGRLVGMGGLIPSKKGKQNDMWWRMDYHKAHDRNDWVDGDYHFHTLTAQ